jgi:predicted transcriptional regulator
MKEPKVLSTYRLPEKTRQQIKHIAEAEKKSEAEVIEWAIKIFYEQEYRIGGLDLLDL